MASYIGPGIPIGEDDIGYDVDMGDFVDDGKDDIDNTDYGNEIHENVSEFDFSGIVDVENDSTSQSSNDEQSDEDIQVDPLYSDGFDDSAFEDDDELYDDNIDKEVEWGGVTESVTISGRGNVGIASGSAIEHARHLCINTPSMHPRSCRSSTQFPVYDGDANHSDFEFSVGLCFKSAAEFREAIRTYSTKQGRPLTFTKNCSNKVQVTCECHWKIFASHISKEDKTFQVKTIKGEHTCTRALFAKHCTSKFLANKYIHHLRSNPEWPVNSMQEIMQMECKTNLTIWKMHRTKRKALKLNEGTEAQQYTRLWDYIEEVKTKNPDTTNKVKCKRTLDSENATFKALYICWGALKKGSLAGCRPIIGLDGTHLKTSKGGVLLTAIGVDGNNCMYPFACAMVLKENTKTREWFINFLIEDLEIRNSFGYTIISDKQKGLIKAIENLLPNYEHRFCLRHMYNNFKMKHKGLALKDLMWRAATATRVVDFNRVMEELKKTNSTAFDWLKGKPPMNWARSHFSTWPKCDMLLNNLCESFNRVIMKARDKPIITMCEIIRLLLMKRFHVQRDKIMKSKGDICPNVQKILESNKKRAHEYILSWNGSHRFELKSWIGDQFIVDVEHRTCSCRRWDLTRIPCVHAIACIFHNRARVEDYVDKWCRKSTFLKAYEHVMEPIRGREEWPDSKLIPFVPWVVETKKLGRPCKYARRKEPDELIIRQETGQKLRNGGSNYRCSKCGKVGHNKRACKEVQQSNRPLVNSNRRLKPKLPVKKKSAKSNPLLDLNAETVVEGSSSTCAAPTLRIYEREGGNFVTQTSTENSTVTRVYSC